jgi:hypothetical protein
MSSKYRTDRTQGPTVVALLSLVGIVSAFSSPNVHIANPVIQIVCIVVLFLVVNTYWGTYILIDDDDIYAVDYFFYKSGLKLDQLSGIYYHPTWIVGSSARTLSIVGFPNGRRKAVRLGTNHFYSFQSLAAIIAEVKKRNPKVDMDRPAAELMERYVDASANRT